MTVAVDDFRKILSIIKHQPIFVTSDPAWEQRDSESSLLMNLNDPVCSSLFPYNLYCFLFLFPICHSKYSDAVCETKLREKHPPVPGVWTSTVPADDGLTQLLL